MALVSREVSAHDFLFWLCIHLSLQFWWERRGLAVTLGWDGPAFLMILPLPLCKVSVVFWAKTYSWPSSTVRRFFSAPFPQLHWLFTSLWGRWCLPILPSHLVQAFVLREVRKVYRYRSLLPSFRHVPRVRPASKLSSEHMVRSLEQSLWVRVNSPCAFGSKEFCTHTLTSFQPSLMSFCWILLSCLYVIQCLFQVNKCWSIVCPWVFGLVGCHLIGWRYSYDFAIVLFLGLKVVCSFQFSVS